MIHHRDHDHENNRLSNLALWTKEEHDNYHARIRTMSNNKSGVRGVYWSNSREKWIARLRADGRGHSRYRDTKEEAIAARRDLERRYLEPNKHIPRI